MRKRKTREWPGLVGATGPRRNPAPKVTAHTELNVRYEAN